MDLDTFGDLRPGETTEFTLVDTAPAPAIDERDDIDLFWFGGYEGRPRSDPPGSRGEAVMGHLVLRATNVPDRKAIARAIGCRPEARAVVEEWEEIFRRNPCLDVVKAAGNENPDTCTPEGIRQGEDRLLGAFSSEREAFGSFSKLARAVVHRRSPDGMGDGRRDWRLHLIDDAFTMASLREAIPGSTTLVVREAVFLYVGLDADGYPMLQRSPRVEDKAVRRLSISAKAQPTQFPYWHRAAFLRAAGRAIVERPTAAAAAATLVAMSRKGYAKAFVKGVNQKSGTWTVPLRPGMDIGDAVAALARAMLPDPWPSEGVMVQEHVPCTHEQRFFVIDGRIAASVCSVRDLCGLDARKGILDARVARLLAPENDAGQYDRGRSEVVEDRVMAAAFARAARKLVREMRAEGDLHYVVDMAMTSRGVVAIEINSLSMSGPYCLDRAAYVRTWRRRMERRVDRYVGTELDWVVAGGPHAGESALVDLDVMSARPSGNGPMAWSWFNRILAASYRRQFDTTTFVFPCDGSCGPCLVDPGIEDTRELPDPNLAMAILPDTARILRSIRMGRGWIVLAIAPFHGSDLDDIDGSGQRSTLLAVQVYEAIDSFGSSTLAIAPLVSGHKGLPTGSARMAVVGRGWDCFRVLLGWMDDREVLLDFARAPEGDGISLVLQASSVKERMGKGSSTLLTDRVEIDLPSDVRYLTLDWGRSRFGRGIVVGNHLRIEDRIRNVEPCERYRPDTSRAVVGPGGTTTYVDVPVD